MGDIVVEEFYYPSVEDMEVEIVERKGLGHPDYICDGVAEAVSKALSSYYFENYGRILHHNVDKVLLVGGQSNPWFGGGVVLQPIRIIVSGRLTTDVQLESGFKPIPFGTIIVDATKRWIKESFRFLDPEVHVIVDYKVGRGSVDLRAIVEAETDVPLANDTSVGLAFAPLSSLERLVYETERYLNSRGFKSKLPMVGEDVKVMGLRRGSKIVLTIASAMISSLILDPGEYVSVKEQVKEEVLDLATRITPNHVVEVYVNTADIREKNIFYLTVTGTSAEHGDDGATGRGNRVNGLITPFRPMSLEATAGKNPVSHVGKIYNVVAKDIAETIYMKLSNKGVREVYVSLLSQIGKPINKPQIANIKIKMEKEMKLTNDIRMEAEALAYEKLERITEYTKKIVRGELQLF
ncbi:MAG: methionine adenosyltransferase [Desulfurococcaceae archaeon]|nr:methionine adenosyltransferase [Desulfurococcaceae archaeon]